MLGILSHNKNKPSQYLWERQVRCTLITLSTQLDQHISILLWFIRNASIIPRRAERIPPLKQDLFLFKEDTYHRPSTWWDGTGQPQETQDKFS